jgi:hypothetical protein
MRSRTPFSEVPPRKRTALTLKRGKVGALHAAYLQRREYVCLVYLTCRYLVSFGYIQIEQIEYVRAVIVVSGPEHVGEHLVDCQIAIDHYCFVKADRLYRSDVHYGRLIC